MTMSFDPCEQLLRAVHAETYHQLITSKINNSTALNQTGVSTAYMWAESIILVANNAGRLGLAWMSASMSEQQKQDFYSAGNQYERSLWLYTHHHDLFNDAVNVLLSEHRHYGFHHALFQLPALSHLNTDMDTFADFKRDIMTCLACSPHEVKIGYLENTSMAHDYSIKVIIDFNELSSVRNYDNKALDITRTRAVSVLYEPSTGILDVMADTAHVRQELAVLFAQHLLGISAAAHVVSPMHYRYQHLAQHRSLDVNDDDVEWAKVTSLGFSLLGRKLSFSINPYDPDDIASATSDISETFYFDDYTLHSAEIMLAIKANDVCHPRNVCIQLSNSVNAVISAYYDHDRELCKRLLKQWRVV